MYFLDFLLLIETDFIIVVFKYSHPGYVQHGGRKEQ